jgi:hypothetical protein
VWNDAPARHVVFQDVERHIGPDRRHRREHVVGDQGGRRGRVEPLDVVGHAPGGGRHALGEDPPRRAALEGVDVVDGGGFELVVAVEFDEAGPRAAAGHPDRRAAAFQFVGDGEHPGGVAGTLGVVCDRDGGAIGRVAGLSAIDGRGTAGGHCPDVQPRLA